MKIGNKLFNIITILFITSLCFGNITRERFFSTSKGNPTTGSFFSGFLFPLNYQHQDVQYMQDSIPGIILQFRDQKNKKEGDIQKNRWILRIPTTNNQIHELTGPFNFDITSDNQLTVELKELEAIKLNNHKIYNSHSPLMRLPLIKDFIRMSTSSFACINADEDLFNKNIILINKRKKEDYIDGAGIKLQTIKEILLQRIETSALAYRLSDNPDDYLVGIIEALPKSNKKSTEINSPQKPPTKYIMEDIDFVYLKYNNGVETSHHRYDS